MLLVLCNITEVLILIDNKSQRIYSIFTQSFNDELDEEKWHELLSSYDTESYFKIKTDENNHLKSFAFCSFEILDADKTIVQTSNSLTIADKQLYVDGFQKKKIEW